VLADVGELPSETVAGRGLVRREDVESDNVALRELYRWVVWAGTNKPVDMSGWVYKL